MNKKVGTEISIEEALRLADKILETAETNRLKYAEIETEKEKYFAEED
jgi:hypothetical protein